jgi:hypothetical protein
MHLTLKKEATRPAGANLLQQQAKFDVFLEEFNNERPHEALAMKCPAEVYSSSCRPYQGIQELHYPFHDKTVVVTNCGRLCLYRKKINLSTCLAAKPSASRKSKTASGSSASWITIWVISIWRKKLCSPSTTPSGQKCYLCLRYILLPMSPGRTETIWLPMQYGGLRLREQLPTT